MNSKRCSTCGEIKPLESFHRSRAQRDGTTGRCKACSRDYYVANREKILAYQREWDRHRAPRAPRDQRDRDRRREKSSNHGISPDRFQEMLNAQDGRCAICRVEFDGTRARSAYIDHDHSCCPGKISCGKCIRGLLCPGCNTALGRLGDTIDGITCALNYLRTYERRRSG